MKLILLFIFFAVVKSCKVIVQTQYGPICGTIKTSRSPLKPLVFYKHFTGIPYAKPPIGDLRFQEPEPPLPWNGIRNATTPGHFCTQITEIFTGDEIIGNEDCLTLEVSVPIQQFGHNSKLPVMVWIHGGSFIFSSYLETGSDYFMEEPVVFVGINYRLNVFGFLSTLDDNAPGNMGLKDQTMALIWIRNNIANFGGDPSRVTIFGASAGGAAVQFHLLSPLSKGLFHRAISHSGVALNTWCFQRNPREMAVRVGAALGIITNDTKVLVNELRKIPAQQLLKTAFDQNVTGSFLLYDEVPFLPSLEHESRKAFLSKRVYESLKSGRFATVPFIIGHTTEEGAFPYEYFDIKYYDINIYNMDPTLFIPISMNIPKGSPNINYTLNAIKQHFFRNTSFTEKVNWIKFMGQDVRGIRKSADFACQQLNHQVFYYIFSYVGTNNLSYIGGAGHYSDVLKILYPDNPQWSNEITPSDRIVQKRMLKLWTNFASTGKPTTNVLGSLKWPEFCQNKKYLEIGNDLVVKSQPDSEMMTFWDNVFHMYGIPPFNTY
ncbi:hypothetical protein FQA39_LY06034 [Lamprigera yunnana]|nr:hypothetical protein FQA39_LY06034 [Lamprigera yunnana]